MGESDDQAEASRVLCALEYGDTPADSMRCVCCVAAGTQLAYNWAVCFCKRCGRAVCRGCHYVRSYRCVMCG